MKSSSAGKGMGPIKGYNPKNWYDNYDQIFRKNKLKENKTNESNESKSSRKQPKINSGSN